MAFKDRIVDTAIVEFRKQYIGKINDVLNEYLAKFELTADLAPDFFYDEREEWIGYALATPAEDEKSFRDFVESFNPKFYYHDFIVSLFHEIGHHETLHTIDEVTRNEYDCLRWSMSAIEYFTHPVELEATLWAIEYIETHMDEVNRLWLAVQPLIIEFFDALSESEVALWV